MEGFNKIMLNTKTHGDPLTVVRQVLFLVKLIYFHRRYREMPFPKNFCYIVVVQLLPWPELGITEDAEVQGWQVLDCEPLLEIELLLKPIPNLCKVP